MLCSGISGRRAQKTGRRETFRDICNEAGVDSTLMDNLLYEGWVCRDATFWMRSIWPNGGPSVKKRDVFIDIVTLFY